MSQSIAASATRFTLTQVAKGLGISPQNLHKTYIKKGKISVDRDELGKPYIEFSEIYRVFGPRFRPPVESSSVTPVDGGVVDGKVDAVDAGLSTGLTEVLRENAELRARLAQADREKADLREWLHEVKTEKERLWGQVERLTDTLKLLKGPEVPTEAPQTPPQDEKKPGWISRLFGR